MSEESSSTGSTDGTASTPPRRKPSPRGGPRGGASTRPAGPAFGASALPSAARASNPSLDDPYHSGQRIWPD